MDKFVIRGGNPLLGTIKVSGAKNSALPCMAAAILTEDEVILENIPQVRDIETERKLLASMGAEVELGYGRAQHRTRIKCAILSDPVAKYEIVKTMRASSLVLGPLIARTGMARVAMPGGCAIGGRPIDLHIKGLEAMGATITQDHGYLEARTDRLKGAHIVFDKITVTGTEDLLMAAALADGETLFENCAREPEVTDLAALLNAMGAKIEGAGTSTIRSRASPNSTAPATASIPTASRPAPSSSPAPSPAATSTSTAATPRTSAPLIAKLEECGVKLDVGKDNVRVRSGGSAQGRRHLHRGVPRLPHRHAGPVHGPRDPGRRHHHRHRKHLRKPLHARRRTQPHGRQHHRQRPHRHRPRQDAAAVRRRHVLGPPRLCRRWSSPPSSPTARPSSTASTTSTAATSTSKKSSAASAPRSAAWATSSAESSRGKPDNLAPYDIHETSS